ncbi:MAG: CoB--CoM heterodisulfide reductase iron-sulfur subunit B family protein [Candidatus Eiseniibacteriota bacterium]
MRRYLYYPGCSVKGTARAYETSLLAVFEALDVQLEELDDWNCCGATAYMSIDEAQAAALAARNLALADQRGLDLVAPCSACWLVLLKTQHQLAERPALRERVGRAMDRAGLRYRGTTRVRHPLDVLVHDVGVEAIAAKIKTPLEGVRAAPYYGCQIVRPYAVFDSQEEPRTMDRLLEACGAKVVDYRSRTRCCGGSQTGTIPEVGLSCVAALVREAVDDGADVIATVCPLCQFNLEVHQRRIRDGGRAPIPVVFFTQILGLALGLSAKQVGLDRCIIPAEAVLTRGAIHAS